MVDLLDIMTDTRNKFVHQGKLSEDGEIEVQILKAIVEICIDKLLSLRKMCPDWDSLAFYYKNEATHPHHLAERIKVLKVIQKTKTKKS